ncbi:MAG: hypothetical protein JWP94_2970 [Mucilaginibacter sp.]|nr:hypothetical protein [Mucilaginibacter sp.]
MDFNIFRGKTGLLMSLAYFSAFVAFLLGLLYGFYSPNKDKDIDNLNAQAKLIRQKEKLEFKALKGEINKLNLKLVDTNQFVFNADRGDLPLLTVDNHTRVKIYPGHVDGLWHQDADAKLGDEIAIQIKYTNSSDFAVNDVSVNISLYHTHSDRSIIGVGNLRVAGKIVKVGVIEIYCESKGLQLSLLSEQSSWIKYPDTLKRIRINSENVFTPKSFYVGNVPAHWYGVITTHFNLTH